MRKWKSLHCDMKDDTRICEKCNLEVCRFGWAITTGLGIEMYIDVDYFVLQNCNKWWYKNCEMWGSHSGCCEDCSFLGCGTL